MEQRGKGNQRQPGVANKGPVGSRGNIISLMTGMEVALTRRPGRRSSVMVTGRLMVTPSYTELMLEAVTVREDSTSPRVRPSSGAVMRMSCKCPRRKHRAPGGRQAESEEKTRLTLQELFSSIADLWCPHGAPGVAHLGSDLACGECEHIGREAEAGGVLWCDGDCDILICRGVQP